MSIYIAKPNAGIAMYTVTMGKTRAYVDKQYIAAIAKNKTKLYCVRKTRTYDDNLTAKARKQLLRLILGKPRLCC